jgi:AAA domain/DnaB-like helicase N terminal domain
MDLDAERAALGGVLCGGVKVLRALGLPAVAFYTESHRAIYRAMLRLADRGEAVDVVTVQSELMRVDEIGLANGSAGLALLLEQGSIAVNVPSYARIIAEHAQTREYDALAKRLANANGDGLAARAAMLRDAETRIRELTLRTTDAIPSEATAFLQHRFPARRDLVARGVLPRAGLGVFNGRPKTNKSILADNLMLARARGAPWLGFATDPGVTLALQAEHSPESWQRRLTAMTAHDPEPLRAGRLHLRTLRGIALNTQAGLSAIHRLLDETPDVDLLRIDPLARYMVGRENSNDEDGMGGVVRAIDTILERGVAVLLVHHQGKPSKEDQRTGGLSLRGGSALYAAADAILTFERDGEAVTIAFELRDAAPLAPLRLTMTPDLWLMPAGPDPELAALARLVSIAPLPYRTLVGAAHEDLKLSEGTAKRRIAAGLAAAVLAKDDDGLYRPGITYQKSVSQSHGVSADA